MCNKEDPVNNVGCYLDPDSEVLSFNEGFVCVDYQLDNNMCFCINAAAQIIKRQMGFKKTLRVPIAINKLSRLWPS